MRGQHELIITGPRALINLVNERPAEGHLGMIKSDGEFTNPNSLIYIKLCLFKTEHPYQAGTITVLPV